LDVGDYATIQKFADMGTTDLSPIYGNMELNGDKAFVQVINQSDQIPYMLSASSDGWMWVYATPESTESTISARIGDDPVPANHVVQLGTFSRNAKTLGVSNFIWDSTVANLTAGALSTIFATVFGNYVKKRISGVAAEAALEGAAEEAGAELVAEGVVEAGVMASIATTLAPLLAGAIVGAIVFFLVMFIANFFFRKYKIAVNIYNWDKANTWVITEWYGDNAALDSSRPWTQTVLPPVSSKCNPESNHPLHLSVVTHDQLSLGQVPLPNGFAPTTGAEVASWATIIFDNGTLHSS
jgi:hypothetical protein